MSKELARKLHAARRAAELTQSELAERLGVTRGAVTQWESTREGMRTTPDVARLREIAKICEVPFTWLVDDKFDPDDARNVRLLNKQGRWQEMPVRYDDNGAPPPPGMPAYVRATVVEPMGVLLHKETEAALLNEEREVDYVPGTRIPDRHPKMVDLFWNTVEYGAVGENELRSSWFDVPVTAYTPKADYFDGRNIVEFSGLNRNGMIPQRLDEKIAMLLLQEKIYGRELNKFLAFWTPTEEPPKNALGAANIAKLAGVEIHYFHEPKGAITFLKRLSDTNS